MSNYELCKRAKLDVKPLSDMYGHRVIDHVILASEVEEMLQNAQVVYGQTEEVPGQVQWSETKIATDTHQARLILVEEIKRELLKHEFEVQVSNTYEHGILLENFKGKRVKVTIQEVG